MKEEALKFLNPLRVLFYDQMDEKTSACLYGSAVTPDWVYMRSDLDLFMIVPQEKVALVGEKINTWNAKHGYPLLDGFIVYQTNTGPMVREFHKFENAYPLNPKFITLIDLWNIKNQSKHLFGQDVTVFVRDICLEELIHWSHQYIDEFWIPILVNLNSRGNISVQIPLSTLVWVASGVGRILMLTEGVICTSKREALLWLSNKFPEIGNTMEILRNQFERNDDSAIVLSGKQAMELNDFYLLLLRAANRR